MYKNIKIEPFNNSHIDSAITLWKTQLAHFCVNSPIYKYWQNNTSVVSEYLKNKDGVIAKIDNAVVGYLTADVIDFHGAKSAIIHFFSSARTIQHRYFIYMQMYKYIADLWIKSGVLNHYITLSYDDIELREAFCNLNFGNYVIDAFADFTKILTVAEKDSESISITQNDDVEQLYTLYSQTPEYYASSPIFLKTQLDSLKEIAELVKNGTVFIAKDQDKIIGYINCTLSKEDDIYRMCPAKTTRTDVIGAYLLPEYRGKGVGDLLMIAIIKHCKSNSVPCSHVDFETANLYANRFWRKYFTPTFVSMKRSVHSDILGGDKPC